MNSFEQMFIVMQARCDRMHVQYTVFNKNWPRHKISRQNLGPKTGKGSIQQKISNQTKSEPENPTQGNQERDTKELD